MVFRVNDVFPDTVFVRAGVAVATFKFIHWHEKQAIPTPDAVLVQVVHRHCQVAFTVFQLQVWPGSDNEPFQVQCAAHAPEKSNGGVGLSCAASQDSVVNVKYDGVGVQWLTDAV